ncbi:MAG: hypothetical protein HOC23_06240, partial [Halieaceae bacterium]|nr:hypothetical protein [Halieaceae bacterium]
KTGDDFKAQAQNIDQDIQQASGALKQSLLAEETPTEVQDTAPQEKP